MKYATDTLLDGLQQQVEALLQTAIQSWQMTAPGRFSTPPPDGGWSAAQCLDHLNGYGDYYLSLLEQAIGDAREKGRLSDTFSPGWLGDYFAKSMEPAADGRVKNPMKAFKAHTPPDAPDADAAIATFIDQQERLIQLLLQARGLDLGRRAIPVSIAPFIRLKTGDAFRFLIAHSRRHAAQAERAMSAKK